MQIIEKKKRDCSEEVEVMLRFSEHPNIVTLHDVYEDQDHVYLFMDLLKGGELLDRILNVGFSERQASEIMEIVAKVVHFLHENGVSEIQWSKERCILSPQTLHMRSVS